MTGPRICGFSISSSSESSSDILVWYFGSTTFLYGWWWWLFVVEDPNDDVVFDASGAHDDRWLWWSLFGPVDAYGDDSYDIWRMMVHDDDVQWWLMMTTMMYDGWCIMMMMYDDDGHGCDLDDHLMMALEIWYVWSLCSMFVMILTWMIETLDPYNRGTWYASDTWVDVLARVVYITSSSICRFLGRLTKHHLHQLLFFNFHLHQLQPSSASTFNLLQHPASSSQLPFAIDAKGGEMFRGRDVLVRGSSPWGGACCQLSSMTKGEIVGQSEPCMVCLSLVFVIDVN